MNEENKEVKEDADQIVEEYTTDIDVVPNIDIQSKIDMMLGIKEEGE